MCGAPAVGWVQCQATTIYRPSISADIPPQRERRRNAPPPPPLHRASPATTAPTAPLNTHNNAKTSLQHSIITLAIIARDIIVCYCAPLITHLCLARRYESNRLSRSIGEHYRFHSWLIERRNLISEHVELDCAWLAVAGGCSGPRPGARTAAACLQTSVTTRPLVTRPLTRVYANNGEPSRVTLSHFNPSTDSVADKVEALSCRSLFSARNC